MNCKLSDLSEYVTEKKPLSDINAKDYISTENLLPNKGGAILCSKMPSVKTVTAYKKGDVLVSNIRPYFKKILFAERDGGCSNDVLVFRAKDGILPAYLYYVLANDAFFDYSTASAKGTKMPRGDKSAIMNYEVIDFDQDVQSKIADILLPLDRKIKLNTQINKNLEEQIVSLCDSWFDSYSRFGGTPPSNWSLHKLSEIADFYSGYSYKGKDLQESSVAMATIKNFDRTGGFKIEGYKEIIPSKSPKETQFAELFDVLIAHTDLTQNAEIIGNAEPILSLGGYDSAIYSMDLVKVTSKDSRVSNFLIAGLLKSKKFKNHCLGYMNGTTVLHLSKKALPEYTLMLPNDMSELAQLNDTLASYYMMIANNIAQNESLKNLRDGLLPRLMSGELNLSEVAI